MAKENEAKTEHQQAAADAVIPGTSEDKVTYLVVTESEAKVNEFMAEQGFPSDQVVHFTSLSQAEDSRDRQFEGRPVEIVEL